MRLLLSHGRNPYFHQAVEEHFLKASADMEGILFLYRNSPSVLCGRNQNLLAECDPQFCQQRQISLLRRISGGGTVYHDEGNLNVAFLVRREEFSPDAVCARIVSALRHLGISAVADGHHSLFVQERKVSGMACALNRNRALLHCCLLVNSDLTTLQKALHSPSATEISAVPSRRAPVANLTEFRPQLTIAELMDAVLHFCPECTAPEDADALPVDTSHCSSPEWIWRSSLGPRLTSCGCAITVS